MFTLPTHTAIQTIRGQLVRVRNRNRAVRTDPTPYDSAIDSTAETDPRATPFFLWYVNNIVPIHQIEFSPFIRID